MELITKERNHICWVGRSGKFHSCLCDLLHKLSHTHETLYKVLLLFYQYIHCRYCHNFHTKSNGLGKYWCCASSSLPLVTGLLFQRTFFTQLSLLFSITIIVQFTQNVHVRARLYQTSGSMLWQLCNDISDSVLIENNGVTPEWGCNSFSSDSIVFIENIIVPSELSRHWYWPLL